jgi:hypothetical protein
MKKVIAAMLICAATLCAQNVSIPSNAGVELLNPLQFLVGTWEAKQRRLCRNSKHWYMHISIRAAVSVEKLIIGIGRV